LWDSILYIYQVSRNPTFNPQTGLVPIDYRGAMLSSLLHVTVYVTHNLLNVLVQIANKIGFKKGPQMEII
jgi:hypothetical protein